MTVCQPVVVAARTPGPAATQSLGEAASSTGDGPASKQRRQQQQQQRQHQQSSSFRRERHTSLPAGSRMAPDQQSARGSGQVSANARRSSYYGSHEQQQSHRQPGHHGKNGYFARKATGPTPSASSETLHSSTPILDRSRSSSASTFAPTPRTTHPTTPPAMAHAATGTTAPFLPRSISPDSYMLNNARRWKHERDHAADYCWRTAHNMDYGWDAVHSADYGWHSQDPQRWNAQQSTGAFYRQRDRRRSVASDEAFPSGSGSASHTRAEPLFAAPSISDQHRRGRSDVGIQAGIHDMAIEDISRQMNGMHFGYPATMGAYPMPTSLYYSMPTGQPTPAIGLNPLTPSFQVGAKTRASTAPATPASEHRHRRQPHDHSPPATAHNGHLRKCASNNAVPTTSVHASAFQNEHLSGCTSSSSNASSNSGNSMDATAAGMSSAAAACAPPPPYFAPAFVPAQPYPIPMASVMDPTTAAAAAAAAYYQQPLFVPASLPNQQPSAFSNQQRLNSFRENTPVGVHGTTPPSIPAPAPAPALAQPAQHQFSAQTSDDRPIIIPLDSDSEAGSDEELVLSEYLPRRFSMTSI